MESNDGGLKGMTSVPDLGFTCGGEGVVWERVASWLRAGRGGLGLGKFGDEKERREEEFNMGSEAEGSAETWDLSVCVSLEGIGGRGFLRETGGEEECLLADIGGGGRGLDVRIEGVFVGCLSGLSVSLYTVN